MTATVEERLLRIECALAEMLKGGYSVYFGDKEFCDRHPSEAGAIAPSRNSPLSTPQARNPFLLSQDAYPRVGAVAVPGGLREELDI